MPLDGRFDGGGGEFGSEGRYLGGEVVAELFAFAEAVAQGGDGVLEGGQFLVGALQPPGDDGAAVHVGARGVDPGQDVVEPVGGLGGVGGGIPAATVGGFGGKHLVAVAGRDHVGAGEFAGAGDRDGDAVDAREMHAEFGGAATVGVDDAQPGTFGGDDDRIEDLELPDAAPQPGDAGA